MNGLLLLLLEAGVALALLIFIVWWTWPKSHNDDTNDKPDNNGKNSGK